VPPNRAEALRLFRLAVLQGEEKAAEELEQLGEPVQGTDRRDVRIVDETDAGASFGLTGISGVTPPPLERTTVESVPSDGRES